MILFKVNSIYLIRDSEVWYMHSQIGPKEIVVYRNNAPYWFNIWISNQGEYFYYCGKANRYNPMFRLKEKLTLL